MTCSLASWTCAPDPHPARRMALVTRTSPPRQADLHPPVADTLPRLPPPGGGHPLLQLYYNGLPPVPACTTSARTTRAIPATPPSPRPPLTMIMEAGAP